MVTRRPQRTSYMYMSFLEKSHNFLNQPLNIKCAHFLFHHKELSCSPNDSNSGHDQNKLPGAGWRLVSYQTIGILFGVGQGYIILRSANLLFYNLQKRTFRDIIHSLKNQHSRTGLNVLQFQANFQLFSWYRLYKKLQRLAFENDFTLLML